MDTQKHKMQAKKTMKWRMDSANPNTTLIQGTQSIVSEDQSISFALTQEMRQFKEDDVNSDDGEVEDDSMLGVSLGTMAANNQFQGFLVEQILKLPTASTANGDPKGRNQYAIGMIEKTDDF